MAEALEVVDVELELEVLQREEIEAKFNELKGKFPLRNHTDVEYLESLFITYPRASVEDLMVSLHVCS